MKKGNLRFGVSWVVVAALLTINLLGISSTRAQAVGTGALTIVATGGSNTGWTYSSGVLTVSSTASIDASVIVGYLSSDLVIDALSITINSAIVSSTDKHLTFRSAENINVAGGVEITTQAGDITFQSDYDIDNVATGSIRLGSHTDTNAGSVNSNGGAITFSGGTNIASGFAVASADLSTGKPVAGVAIYGFSIQAGGGNITLRGRTLATGATSSRAVIIEKNNRTAGDGKSTLQTSGVGEINVIGDSTSSTGANPWGPTMSDVEFITVDGDINITGESNKNTGGSRGFASSKITYLSGSGDINLSDRTVGNSTPYAGSYFGGPNDFSTSGNINILSDKIVSENAATLTMTADAVNIKSFSTASFLATPTFGVIAASGVTGSLSIGQASNGSALTFANSVTSGAPVALYGAAITVNAAVTATNTSLTINASGAVTQSAAISVGSLALNGTGPFTLTNSSNSIGTISGGTSVSPIGTVNVVDSLESLIIGQVGSFTGLYSTGVIEIATTVGNISVTQPVSSTATNASSIKLYANKATAAGTTGTGNVTFSGSGSTSIDATSRALFYSGARTPSTGLVTEVGGLSNVRTSIDLNTNLSGVTPALNATGKYALLRVSESQTITFALPADKSVGTTFASGATSDSGLTVSLSSSTTGICTVSGLNITTVAQGTCTVVASQAGDNAVSAASTVTRSFNVEAATAQIITFVLPSGKFVGDTFASGATSDSGLTVSLSSSTTGICTVSGLNITTVAAGTCTIVASQNGGTSGSTTYSAATSVTRSFTVTAAPAPAAPVIPMYRIDFGTNTGTGNMSSQFAIVGSTIVLEPNLYQKEGFTFTGWNTKADGTGISYADKSSFKIDSSDVTLFAQWKIIPPIIVEVPVTVITSNQKVFFAMSSFALSTKAKANLTGLAKRALESGKSFTVTVVGFTQPTPNDPNFNALAKNRAKAAANFLRAQGVRGSYSIAGVGQALRNIASSRYAEVTIVVKSK